MTERGRPRGRAARAAAPPPPQPVRRARASTSEQLDDALEQPRPTSRTPEPRRPRDGGGPDRRRRRRRQGDRPTSPARAPRARRERRPTPPSRPARPRRPAGPRAAPRRAPASRSGPGCCRCRGIGEGAPGRRSRARTDRGRATGAPRARRAGHRLHLTATCAPPRRTSRPAAATGPGLRAAPRRPARGGPRGPRGQPRALRRRRVRLDGRPAADERGQGRGAVAAARRLPAPRQGRPDHLPRHRRRAGAAADLVGRRGGRPARPTLPTGGRTPLAAGLLRGRTTCCASSGCATRAAARCSSWSPTAGPPAAPSRRRRRRAAPAARRDGRRVGRRGLRVRAGAARARRRARRAPRRRRALRLERAGGRRRSPASSRADSRRAA